MILEASQCIPHVGLSLSCMTCPGSAVRLSAARGSHCALSWPQAAGHNFRFSKASPLPSRSCSSSLLRLSPNSLVDPGVPAAPSLGSSPAHRHLRGWAGWGALTLLGAPFAGTEAMEGQELFNCPWKPGRLGSISSKLRGRRNREGKDSGKPRWASSLPPSHR